MYCHHCNKKRTDDAVYCSQCGRQLLFEDAHSEALEKADWTEDFEESAASIDLEGVSTANTVIEATMEQKKYGKHSVWLWLMPIILAIAMTALVYVYYDYESGINDRVIELQTKGKVDAIAGKYEEALTSLEQARGFRPEYAAVQLDIAIVTHALGLEQSIKVAAKQLDEQRNSDAEHTIGQIKDELKGHVEPVYFKIKELLEAQTVKLAVIKLTEDYSQITTVDALIGKLNIANGLEGEEARAVREQIVARIVEVSLEKADSLLKSKDYSAALSVVERAFVFSKENEQLLVIKKRIEKAQQQYEKAEQIRLEQAMQKAAAEDLKNQTAAVEVLKIEKTLDEFGDLTIQAQFKNVATRPIYGVSIKFIVYNAKGEEVGSGKAEATPNYIETGENMNAAATIYGIHDENTTIVAEPIKWYLD